ncbi:hypothetical protein IJT10_02910 [bacterium]|nr:hypothetical protein [bacterium]
MSSISVNILRRVFALNFNMHELQETFYEVYKAAVFGKIEDAQKVIEFLGKPNANINSIYLRKELEIYPLPEEGQIFQDINLAIIHLGNKLPKGSTLKRYVNSFAPNTTLLFLLEGDVDELLESESVLKNQEFREEDDHLYYRYDPTLPPITILAKDYDDCDLCASLSDGGAWVYSLARDYDNLRTTFINSLIKNTAEGNAMVAAASSVSADIPFIGTLASMLAVPWETLHITAEQIRLALIIGALYGKSLDLNARLAELLPVVGWAWGWRNAARELVGLIPVAGPLSKATIAWVGTYSIAKLAQRFYESTEPIDEDYKQKVLKEAVELSKTVVK